MYPGQALVPFFFSFDRVFGKIFMLCVRISACGLLSLRRAPTLVLKPYRVVSSTPYTLGKEECRDRGVKFINRVLLHQRYARTYRPVIDARNLPMLISSSLISRLLPSHPTPSLLLVPIVWYRDFSRTSIPPYHHHFRYSNNLARSTAASSLLLNGVSEN